MTFVRSAFLCENQGMRCKRRCDLVGLQNDSANGYPIKTFAIVNTSETNGYSVKALYEAGNCQVSGIAASPKLKAGQPHKALRHKHSRRKLFLSLSNYSFDISILVSTMGH